MALMSMYDMKHFRIKLEQQMALLIPDQEFASMQSEANGLPPTQ
jgi:hypothetical protein